MHVYKQLQQVKSKAVRPSHTVVISELHLLCLKIEYLRK